MCISIEEKNLKDKMFGSKWNNTNKATIGE